MCPMILIFPNLISLHILKESGVVKVGSYRF
jgi:hypothetical protein